MGGLRERRFLSDPPRPTHRSMAALAALAVLFGSLAVVVESATDPSDGLHHFLLLSCRIHLSIVIIYLFESFSGFCFTRLIRFPLCVKFSALFLLLFLNLLNWFLLHDCKKKSKPVGISGPRI